MHCLELSIVQYNNKSQYSIFFIDISSSFIVQPQVRQQHSISNTEPLSPPTLNQLLHMYHRRSYYFISKRLAWLDIRVGIHIHLVSFLISQTHFHLRRT